MAGHCGYIELQIQQKGDRKTTVVQRYSTRCSTQIKIRSSFDAGRRPKAVSSMIGKSVSTIENWFHH